MDNIQSDDQRLRELSLFAGGGGGILGGLLCGWRCVCAVEFDQHAREVLVARQNDGCLEPFPIWDDVRTFDGREWRGIVDVVSGGFPCQDISAAGKGAGIDGERSGLWREMERIIGEVRPRFCIVENSPMLVGRGLAVVLGDLASLGYDARWGVLGAADAGAPHRRDRIWIVGALADAMHSGQRREPRQSENSADAVAGLADADCINGRTGTRREDRTEAYDHGRQSANTDVPRREEQRFRVSDGEKQPATQCGGAELPDAENKRLLRRVRSGGENPEQSGFDGRGETIDACGQWWATEPRMGRVADGLAAGVDIHGADALGGVARVGRGIPHRAERLKRIGNGQVPSVVRMAWKMLANKEGGQ